MDALSDGLQTLRTVVDSVHGGHIGQQGLGSANVTSGLITADVLLTGLQGQTVRLFAVDISAISFNLF